MDASESHALRASASRTCAITAGKGAGRVTIALVLFRIYSIL